MRLHFLCLLLLFANTTVITRSATAIEIVKVARYDGYSDSVTAVACDPDMRMICCGTRNGEVQMRWIDADRVEMTRCKDGISSLSFSRDGTSIAIGTYRGVQLRAVDDITKSIQFETARLDKELGHTYTHCVFSTENVDTLLTAGGGPNAAMWNVASLECTMRLDTRPDPFRRPGIESLALSPKERYVALGTTHDTVENYQTTNGKRVQRLGQVSKADFSGGGILGVAFSPNGTLLAAGPTRALLRGPDLGKVHVWETTNWTKVATLKYVPTPQGLEFLPDGESLLITGAGMVDLWETSTWKRVLRQEMRQTDSIIHSFALASKRKLLVLGLHGRSVEIWKLNE